MISQLKRREEEKGKWKWKWKWKESVEIANELLRS